MFFPHQIPPPDIDLGVSLRTHGVEEQLEVIPGDVPSLGVVLGVGLACMDQRPDGADAILGIAFVELSPAVITLAPLTVYFPDGEVRFPWPTPAALAIEGGPVGLRHHRLENAGKVDGGEGVAGSTGADTSEGRVRGKDMGISFLDVFADSLADLRRRVVAVLQGELDLDVGDVAVNACVERLLDHRDLDIFLAWSSIDITPGVDFDALAMAGIEQLSKELLGAGPVPLRLIGAGTFSARALLPQAVSPDNDVTQSGFLGFVGDLLDIAPLTKGQVGDPYAGPHLGRMGLSAASAERDDGQNNHDRSEHLCGLPPLELVGAYAP